MNILNKSLKKIRFLIFAVSSFLLVTMQTMTVYATPSTFNITVSQAASDTGAVTIDWSKSGFPYSDKYFKVYKKYIPVAGVTDVDKASEEYVSIGIDYKQVTNVKVLQIYPNVGANQIKNWVQNSGYGKGIISVTAVSNSSFNSAPGNYLYQNADGSWSYDVVFYGTWDSNNGQTINVKAYEVLQRYLECGKGVIFGHDVAQTYPVALYSDFSNNTISRKFSGDRGTVGYTQIKLVRTGLFTTYPNSIGKKGTVLSIPMCHTSSQYYTTSDVVWAKFTGDSWSPKDGYGVGSIYDAYMMTTGNIAVIQTGHSSGKSTTDEQKIIANLCFYCNQMLFGSSHSTDYSATDYAIPVITSGACSNNVVTWSAHDNGTTYKYYVEAFDKNDTSSSGVIATSNEVQTTVTVGIDHYRYILDMDCAEKVIGQTVVSYA